MNNFITIDEIITATNGRIISKVNDHFISVGTDTRKSLQGQLFIALKGETHDAHEYIDQAVQAGASGLLIHRWNEKFSHLKSDITIIQVEDTLLALQTLGHLRRKQWGKPLIAVTGSNGKTTTKEFMAQILSLYKKVHFNQGSFNNHWGLPLTLLGLKPEHEIAICEMGMNHPGEITALVTLSEPNIVGVTTVGRAHLEGLGSISLVAKAKAEIYKLNESSFIEKRIFNFDNEWTKAMYETLSLREKDLAITFSSKNQSCDVQLKVDNLTLEGLDISGTIKSCKGSVHIPVFGKQNIENLMFAACAALAAGLSPEQIWKAFPNCKTIWGRNQRLIHSSGAEFLFDGYNANPDSQKALLENLLLLKTTKPLIGIFGEMKELGEKSAELHEELGSLVASVPFQEIFFVGNYSNHFKSGFEKSLNKDCAHIPIHSFIEINETLISQLRDLLNTQPLVTIKGSRGVGLEKILKSLSLL